MIRIAMLPHWTFAALALVGCSSGGNAEVTGGQTLPKLSISPLSGPLDKALGQSVSRAIAIEGDQSTELSSAVFLVSLTAPSSSTVSVAVAVTPDDTGTSPAESGLDFKPIDFVLRLPPGETTATIAVPVRGDLLYETNETFAVTLSDPQNATLGNSRAFGEIISNDPQPPVVVDYLPGGNGSIQEGTGDATIVTPVCARVGGGSEVNGKIRWKLNLGTASAADIRLLDTEVVTLPSSGARRCARLEVAGDSDPETLETASVVVEIAGFLQAGNPMSRTVTIVSDDVVTPQNVQAMIQHGNLVATWDPVTNATAYEVSLDVGDEFGTRRTLSNTSMTSWSFGSSTALVTLDGSATVSVTALFSSGARSASASASPIPLTGAFRKTSDVADPGGGPVSLRNPHAGLQLSAGSRFLNLADFTLSADSLPIPTIGPTESLRWLAITNDGRRVVYARYDHDFSVEAGALHIYDRVTGSTSTIHVDGLRGYFAAAIGAGDVIWKVDSTNATGFNRYNPGTGNSVPIAVDDTSYIRIALAGSVDERFAYAIKPSVSPGFSGYLLVRDNNGTKLLDTRFFPKFPPQFEFASRGGESVVAMSNDASTQLFRMGATEPQVLVGGMFGAGITTTGSMVVATSDGIYRGSMSSGDAPLKIARWPIGATCLAVLSDGSLSVSHAGRLKKITPN